MRQSLKRHLNADKTGIFAKDEKLPASLIAADR